MSPAVVVLGEPDTDFRQKLLIPCMDSRLATALVGLAVSVVVSALLAWYFNALFLFLFLPFVPFLFRRSTKDEDVVSCPECGFRTRNPEFTHCPRDGSRLERRGE